VTVLVALADEALCATSAAALGGEGLTVRQESDLSKLVGAIASDLLEPEVPSLVIIGGVPAAVLSAIIETFRRDPKTLQTKLMVVDANIGIEERAKLLNAGADDVQPRVLADQLLAARARNLLRRGVGKASVSGAAASDLLLFGPFSIDPVKRAIAIGEKSLRFTRLQFDFLSTLATAKSDGRTSALISERLASLGHAVGGEALTALIVGMNREILLHGWELVEHELEISLSEASAEDRLPPLALALLQAASTALSNARIYHEGHQAVRSFCERAQEVATEISACLGTETIKIEESGGVLKVNGRDHDQNVPSPEGVVDFYRAYQLRSIKVAKSASVGDWMGLALLSKLDAMKSKPEDAGAFLQGNGVQAISVEKALAYDVNRSKTLALEFARCMSENRDLVGKLFVENAVFTITVRGKSRTFEGRQAIAEFLSSYPANLSFQVTGQRGEEDQHAVTCVVAGGNQAPVKDEYRFSLAEDCFERFEAVSRLRV